VNLEVKRKKAPPQSPKIVDACPKCRKKFKEHYVKVVYKDFVECNYCGNMWIAFDYNELKKWV